MREIGGAITYRPWKEWDEEDFIQGKYVGKGEDDYGKDNYTFELTEFEFSDDAFAEENNLSAGSRICLNSCGSLDVKMDNVEVGEFVKIIYTGTIVLKKGKYKGKESHTVRVFLLDDNSAGDDVEEAPKKPKAKKGADDTSSKSWDPFAGL